MKRYCFAFDLKESDKLIAEYEKKPQNIWPEIRESIISSGIADLQFYRTGNRMFMIMETTNEFSFGKRRSLTPLTQSCKNGKHICRVSSRQYQRQRKMKSGL